MEKDSDKFQKLEKSMNLTYLDIKVYSDYVEEYILIDGEIYKRYKLLNNELKNYTRFNLDNNILDDNIENVFKKVYKFNNIFNKFTEIISIITNNKYTKSIEKTMSVTYYENVESKREKLIKEIKKNRISYIKLIGYISENLNTDLIIKTGIHTVEDLYIKYLSSSNGIIFSKCLSIYEDNNIDTSYIKHKLSAYILGYNNEKLNYKPYSNYPILLMGLTFNLQTDNLFIRDNELKINNIIKINNSIYKYNRNYIYNMNKLIYGRYSGVNRVGQINKNIINFGNTIELNIHPMINKINKNNILDININNTDNIELYETIDGVNYRKYQNKNIKNLKDISNGPDPIIYLYNKELYKKFTSDTDYKSNINFSEIERVDVNVTKLKKIKDIDKLYNTLYPENSYNKEKTLYNIFITNSYMKEIKRMESNIINIVDYNISNLL